ncbi:unnamed protein product [Protopolystoma xenopodis]|uniref:Uncharacterized protein n=1 Tax=Protopolystoma xenopodis TaxID=117903 RepID=A0A3S5CCL5_9PLAT|nr:unnamed protein product [Protopolystoma xenopodis]
MSPRQSSPALAPTGHARSTTSSPAPAVANFAPIAVYMQALTSQLATNSQQPSVWPVASHSREPAEVAAAWSCKIQFNPGLEPEHAHVGLDADSPRRGVPTGRRDTDSRSLPSGAGSARRYSRGWCAKSETATTSKLCGSAAGGEGSWVEREEEKTTGGRGEWSAVDFLVSLCIAGRFQHKNLVQLLGAITEQASLPWLMVSEWVPRGRLDCLLKRVSESLSNTASCDKQDWPDFSFDNSVDICAEHEVSWMS